jgi:hypothetical protein
MNITDKGDPAIRGVHPIDVLKQVIIDNGGDVDPYVEKQLRSICDEIVCNACGKSQFAWSKTPPTVPGWYWYRDNDGTDMIHFDGVAFWDEGAICKAYGFIGGDWCGPLTPPE